MIAIFRRFRLAQVRFCSKIIRRLSRIPLLFIVIRSVRELSVFRNLFVALLGYNRPFATLDTASASIARFVKSSHEHPDYVELHMMLAESARPSDYPALFHIQTVLPHIRSVFDFGGNAGNLFYGYSRYLELPQNLAWTVYDLPKNLDVGARLAKEKREGRLRFTGNFTDAEETDLFIASGSLHYFDKPLFSIIAELKKKPTYVLINRTPFAAAPTLATVQDGGGDKLFSCMVYNRDEMIKGFEHLGYATVDVWQAAELSLIIPGYPDRSAMSYSGMFFRQKN